jgi:hypothetical protein
MSFVLYYIKSIQYVILILHVQCIYMNMYLNNVIHLYGNIYLSDTSFDLVTLYVLHANNVDFHLIWFWFITFI